MKTKFKIYFILVLTVLLTGDIKSQTLSSEEIYEIAKGSVMLVRTYDCRGIIISQGSAVAVNDEGIVYTCFHVIQDAEKIELEKEGKKIYEVTIIGADPEKDAAVLKIQCGEIKVLRSANSDSVKIGEIVYAIGSPLGYENTFSNGVISALRDDNSERKNKQIQFNAGVSPGSSGGALLNIRGELIGITYLCDIRGQNLNFAIPVNYFLELNLADFNDSKQVHAINAYCKAYSSYENEGYFKAAEYFNQYLDVFSNDLKAKLLSGKNYLNRGLYDSAIARYNEVINIDTMNHIAFRLRGEAYQYKGDSLKAIEDYNKTVELDSNNYFALIERAFLNHYIMKNYNEALNDYNRCIKLIPDYTFLYKYRGEVYLEKGDTDIAIDDLYASINPEIDIAETCYDRGRIFAELSLHNDAIEDFTRAIKLEPYNDNYYFSRAIEYFKIENYISAISDYTEVLRLNPANSPAYSNTGYCHFNLKELDESERYFKRALIYNKYEFDSYLGLAMIYFERNDKRECLGFLKKAEELEPLIKKGIKGIAKLEKTGYFWSKYELSILNKIFKMAGYKHKDEEKNRKGRGYKKAKPRKVKRNNS